jgi:hypothetical protein
MAEAYKNIPFGINAFTPQAKPDAKEITALIKQGGKVTGYKLSSGEAVSKPQGIALAKSGDIKHVGVATRKGSEYLRTLPDGSEGNNLSNLPSVTQQ